MAWVAIRLALKAPTFRAFHTTPAATSWLDRVMFNLEQFPKYGLLADDLLSDFDQDVVEAVSRLPEDVQMQRLFRCIRAAQLNIEQSILPKEQWTRYEDDNHYLQPYLAEVVAERLERETWEKNH